MRDGIRLALAEVKGINDGEVERIVAARPFHSLTDFWHRAGSPGRSSSGWCWPAASTRSTASTWPRTACTGAAG
jgi:hypothetical protein